MQDWEKHDAKRRKKDLLATLPFALKWLIKLRWAWFFMCSLSIYVTSNLYMMRAAREIERQGSFSPNEYTPYAILALIVSIGIISLCAWSFIRYRNL